jgi:hypothetical protein
MTKARTRSSYGDRWIVMRQYTSDCPRCCNASMRPCATAVDVKSVTRRYGSETRKSSLDGRRYDSEYDSRRPILRSLPWKQSSQPSRRLLMSRLSSVHVRLRPPGRATRGPGNATDALMIDDIQCGPSVALSSHIYRTYPRRAADDRWSPEHHYAGFNSTLEHLAAFLRKAVTRAVLAEYF